MSTIAEVAPKTGAEQKFKVTVVYNGVSKTIEVELHETIKAVLERAIHAFGSIPNSHMLSLFNEAGQELKDEQHVKDAGIKPGDKLLLRPGAVKGGAT